MNIDELLSAMEADLIKEKTEKKYAQIQQEIQEVLDGMQKFAVGQLKKQGWSNNFWLGQHLRLYYRHGRKYGHPEPAWQKNAAVRKQIKETLELAGYQKVSVEVEYDSQVDSYPVLAIRAIVRKV